MPLSTSVGALGFTGLTAGTGGTDMLAFPQGNVFVDGDWLDHLPVSDYRLPGLVLAGVIGAGSLVAAYGLVRRPRWRWAEPLERRTGMHWSWAATGLAGLVLAAWLLVEVVLIPERSTVEGVYGMLAALLVGSCLTPSFRRARRGSEM